MQAAANFINNGRYQEAINVLNGIDNKTAQWYYYSAIANSGIGNNVIALQHAREAVVWNRTIYSTPPSYNDWKMAETGTASNKDLTRQPSQAAATGA